MTVSWTCRTDGVMLKLGAFALPALVEPDPAQQFPHHFFNGLSLS